MRSDVIFDRFADFEKVFRAKMAEVRGPQTGGTSGAHLSLALSLSLSHLLYRDDTAAHFTYHLLMKLI